MSATLCTLYYDHHVTLVIQERSVKWLGASAIARYLNSDAVPSYASGGVECIENRQQPKNETVALSRLKGGRGNENFLFTGIK